MVLTDTIYGAKAADYYVVKSADSTELKTNIRKAFESSGRLPIRKTTKLRQQMARQVSECLLRVWPAQWLQAAHQPDHR